MAFPGLDVISFKLYKQPLFFYLAVTIALLFVLAVHYCLLPSAYCLAVRLFPIAYCLLPIAWLFPPAYCLLPHA
jgi:hypothetical protein